MGSVSARYFRGRGFASPLGPLRGQRNVFLVIEFHFSTWFGAHIIREVPLLNNQTVPCNAKTPYIHASIHTYINKLSPPFAPSLTKKYVGREEEEAQVNKVCCLRAPVFQLFSALNRQYGYLM